MSKKTNHVKLSNYCNHVQTDSFGVPKFNANGTIMKADPCTTNNLRQQLPSCGNNWDCGGNNERIVGQGKNVFYTTQKSLCSQVLGGAVNYTVGNQQRGINQSDVNSGYLNMGGSGRAYTRGGCIINSNNPNNPGTWNPMSDTMTVNRQGCEDGGYVYGNDLCFDENGNPEGCGNVFSFKPVVDGVQMGCRQANRPGYNRVGDLGCARSSNPDNLKIAQPPNYDESGPFMQKI